jgi:iron complex outermembrane receptor protein
VGTTGGVIPRWRHRAEVDWKMGDWDAFVAQNWQGSYQDVNPGTMVGSYETYDLNLGYTGFKNLRLNLGVKNVLDRDPPFTAAGGGYWFQSGYDPAYVDPRARFAYLSVAYRVK